MKFIGHSVSKEKNLHTNVDIKYFKQKACINEELSSTESYYAYKIIFKSIRYILKGYKIPLESIKQVNEIYQTYFLTKTICCFNKHFVKPLCLDCKVEFSPNKCIYIEILFEFVELTLNKLNPLADIDQLLNLMMQSSSALSLLHSIGIEGVDIRPENIVYDNTNDVLKIISPQSTDTNEMECNKSRVLRGKNKLGVDSYNWAMCFYSLIRQEETKEENLMKVIETNLQSLKGTNSLREKVKNLLRDCLKSNPRERPTMREIVKMINQGKNKTLMDLPWINYEQSTKNNKERKVLYKYDGCEDCLIESALKVILKYRKEQEYCKCILCNKFKGQEVVELASGRIKSKSGKISHFTLTTSKDSLNEIKFEHKDNNQYKINSLGDGIEIISKALTYTDVFTKLNLSSMLINSSVSESISNALKVNTSLKELDLSENEIGSGASKLADALKINKTLALLDLGVNNIPAEDLATIIRALNVNESLTHLSLKGSSIRPEDSKLLYEVFKNNKNLVALNLDWNTMTEFTAVEAFRMLVKNKVLKELYTVGNPLKDSSIELICEALRTSKTLTHLSLGWTQADDFEDIGKVLITNKSLIQLNLKDCRIGSDSAQLIAKALKINRTLTYLNLENNLLEDKGVAPFNEALKVNKALIYLNLGLNKLQKINIGNGLKANKSLKELYLQENKIDNESLISIKEALEDNNTLMVLDLASNNIDITGISSICEGLKVNVGIEQLYLCGNEMKEDKLSIIGEMLKVNKTLKELHLEDTSMSSVEIKFLCKLLKDSEGITGLHLAHNYIKGIEDLMSNLMPLKNILITY